MRLHCYGCGKSVSNWIPDDTVMRAVAWCPGCIEAGRHLLEEDEKPQPLAARLEDFSRQFTDETRALLLAAAAESRLLDALQAMTKGYGKGWILRESTTGRGMRLHETSQDGARPTVREAIREVMEKPDAAS